MAEVQTLTLADFLLARIAEDENAAAVEQIEMPQPNGDVYYVPGRPKPSDVRVLAECRAKRRIVELHGGEEYPNPTDEPVDMECTSFGARLRYPEYCRTLRHLATVYADHPDYHDDWRP